MVLFVLPCPCGGVEVSMCVKGWSHYYYCLMAPTPALLGAPGRDMNHVMRVLLSP